jgi:hypothetical protein
MLQVFSHQPNVGADVEGLGAQHQDHGFRPLLVVGALPVGLGVGDPLCLLGASVGERREKR